MNFIEFGTFKSTTKRAITHWPSQITTSSSTLTAAAGVVAPLPSVPLGSMRIITNVDHPNVTTVIMPKETTVRGKAEEKRQQKQTICIQSLKLAETDVHSAMKYMREKDPIGFVSHSTWYISVLPSFVY